MEQGRAVPQPGSAVRQAPSVAILIPCYNEGLTIARVVERFRAQLPGAAIYVFDNNSKDNTIAEAARAGAIVQRETRQGKGFVIRSMFRRVDADVYVMVDGDGTYPADRAHALIAPILAGEADMAIGSRLHRDAHSRFKLLNRLGNAFFLLLVNGLFRVKVTDLLSGYRAMSRRVVKGIPFLSQGFEIETELTVKCLSRGLQVVEVPVDLVPRPQGSYSKIRIVQDGLLIANSVFSLARDYKPLTAFGLLGGVLIAAAAVPGFIVIREFLETGLILRMPSAVLAVGLVLAGLLMVFVGVVLHSLARHFQELDCQLQQLLEYRYGAAPAAAEPQERPVDGQR